MKISEHALLRDLKAGYKEAVYQWYVQYHAKVLAYVVRKLPNDKDAEEITQDIFLSCLRHLPLFRGDSSILTWMISVAKHEMADYYRKRYAKKFIHALPLSELLGSGEIYNAHETSQKVAIVLKKMTAESCEILQMKYVDKKKVKEIASEMGKTVKSVESILFRARAEFRELYVSETGSEAYG